MLIVIRRGAIALFVGLIGCGDLAHADGQKTQLTLPSTTKVDASVDSDAPGNGLRPGGEAPSEPDRSTRASRVIWTPSVNRGRPAAREGGASRSAGEGLSVRALVPRLDESALTVSAQPSLFFALQSHTPHAINFTLIDPDAIAPLIDVMLDGPFEAGIHRLDLSRHGVNLEVGRSYEWFVAIVPDPEQRSADSVARGAILRVARPELERRIAGEDGTEVAADLASEGIWYDALSTLSDRVDATPDSVEARSARASLLEQEGVADFEWRRD